MWSQTSPLRLSQTVNALVCGTRVSSLFFRRHAVTTMAEEVFQGNLEGGFATRQALLLNTSVSVMETYYEKSAREEENLNTLNTQLETGNLLAIVPAHRLRVPPSSSERKLLRVLLHKYRPNLGLYFLVEREEVGLRWEASRALEAENLPEMRKYLANCRFRPKNLRSKYAPRHSWEEIKLPEGVDDLETKISPRPLSGLILRVRWFLFA